MGAPKAEAKPHRQQAASSASSLALPSQGPGGSVGSSELSSLLLSVPFPWSWGPSPRQTPMAKGSLEQTQLKFCLWRSRRVMLKEEFARKQKRRACCLPCG